MLATLTYPRPTIQLWDNPRAIESQFKLEPVWSLPGVFRIYSAMSGGVIVPSPYDKLHARQMIQASGERGTAARTGAAMQPATHLQDSHRCTLVTSTS
jgi:hypothetical protein